MQTSRTNIVRVVSLCAIGAGLARPAAGAPRCAGAPMPPDLSAAQCIWNLDMIDVCDSAPPDNHRRTVAETGAGVNIAVLDSGLVPDWRCYLPQNQIDTAHARSCVKGSACSAVGWDRTRNT